MIVSHEHKFIFIKTEKTASSSMEAFLCQFCGDDDIITPTREDLAEPRPSQRRAQNYMINHPAVPRRSIRRRLLRRPLKYYHPEIGFYEHMPAWRVRLYVGEATWNEYFKFAFERNPWPRQVSFYKYKTQNRRDISFEKFLQRKKRAYIPNFERYSIDGEVALDFIGRHENIAEDFAFAISQIGIHTSHALPHVNVSKQSYDYRKYYNSKTRDLISRWYQREINYFQYEF